MVELSLLEKRKNAFNNPLTVPTLPICERYPINMVGNEVFIKIATGKRIVPFDRSQFAVRQARNGGIAEKTLKKSMS